MDKQQDICKLLRELRKARGLGLYNTAIAAGISPSYLWRIEAGERHPSARFLHKVAKVLDCNEAELLITAGFLPEESRDNQAVPYPGLDSEVANYLSQESYHNQQYALTILRFLKQMKAEQS